MRSQHSVEPSVFLRCTLFQIMMLEEYIHWFRQSYNFFFFDRIFRKHTKMKLAPREIEKLMLHNAGELAQKRLARGLRLNHVEAVALIATQVYEFLHLHLLLLPVFFWLFSCEVSYSLFRAVCSYDSFDYFFFLNFVSCGCWFGVFFTFLLLFVVYRIYYFHHVISVRYTELWTSFVGAGWACVSVFDAPMFVYLIYVLLDYWVDIGVRPGWG